MSNIYCGINEVPKGQKLGTQEECINKGQIRYYGIKRIKKSLITEKKSSYKKDRMSLIKQLGFNQGKIRKFKINYDKQRDPEKKKIIKTEAEILIKENQKISKKLKALVKKHSKQSKQSRLSKIRKPIKIKQIKKSY